MPRWATCSSNRCAKHCSGGSRPAAWRPVRPGEMRAMHEWESLIDAAWEKRASLDAGDAAGLRTSLNQVMDALEAGALRVAEPDGQGGWRVNQWVKRAILLYFRAHDMRLMDGGSMTAWDKVPLRFSGADEAAFRNAGARVVPGALVRRGAFIGNDAVLMPSYVNIGAHVGPGAMVDTRSEERRVGKECRSRWPPAP